VRIILDYHSRELDLSIKERERLEQTLDRIRVAPDAVVQINRKSKERMSDENR